MNVIEISANEHQELRSNQIMAIFMRSYQRKCLILQLRAFRRWSESFPLQVKCIEISRQLSERNEMLESLRTSYLKDVVSVKYQLVQLSSLTQQTVDQHISRKVIEEKLSGLHMIPSADLRQIVEKAEKTMKSDGTSTMLRDTLIDAGLMDPETCKVYNPWEQSRSYRRLNRMQKGPAYNYPDTGGNSIELARPYDYKLFVRYCRECIGVVQFVKSWNTDIEATLRFKAEYGQVELRIQELRRVIDSLQNSVIDKEQEIIRLEDKNKQLEEANHWFEKWSYIKDVEQREAEHKEKLSMYINLAEMAETDKESALWNVQYKNTETVSDLRHQLNTLQRALRKDQTDRDTEASTRIKMAEELQHVLSQKSTMKAEIDRLKSLRAQDASEHEALLKRIKKVETVCQELEAALQKKEYEFEDYRRVTSDRIEELLQQYKTVSRDYETKEKELDDMRIDLRQKKKQNTEYALETADLKSRIDQYKAEKRRQRPKRHEQGYRPTLKVVVFAVLSLVRLHRSARLRQWEDLGYFGSQLLLRQQQQRNFCLQQHLSEVEEENTKHQRLLEQYRGGKDDMHRKLRELEELAEKRKDEIKQLTRSLDEINRELLMTKGERDSAKRQLADRVKAKRDLILPIVQRAKIYSNLQRILASDLAKAIFSTRSIVRSFDVEFNMSQIYRDKALLDKMLVNDATRQSPSSTALQTLSSNSRELPTIEGPSRKRSSPVQATSTLTVIRQLDFNAIWRNKGNSLINWIRTYRSQNQIKMKARNDELVDRWLSGMENITTAESGPVSLLSPEAHIRYLHHKDASVVDTMRGELTTDIRMIDDYISLLRERNSDLQNRLEDAVEYANNLSTSIDENNRVNNVKSDRSVASYGSRGSRGSGQSTLRHLKVRHVKSSFAHLMEKDMTTYLSKVIEAIETVQNENPDLLSIKDDISSNEMISIDSGPGATAISGNSGGGGEFQSVVRTSVLAKRSRRASMRSRLLLPDVIHEENTSQLSFIEKVSDDTAVAKNQESAANNEESQPENSPQRSSASSRRSRRRSSILKRSNSNSRRSFISNASGGVPPQHHISGQILSPLHESFPLSETATDGVTPAEDDEMKIMRMATAAAALWQGQAEPQQLVKTSSTNHNPNKRVSKQAVILDRSGHSMLRRSGGVVAPDTEESKINENSASKRGSQNNTAADPHRHYSTATQLTEDSNTDDSLKLEYYFMAEQQATSPMKIEPVEDDQANNDDDLLDDDDLMYEEEVLSVYDDLEAAKKEALIMLQRDQQLKKEIEMMKADKEQLWSEIGILKREVSDLKREKDFQRADNSHLKEDLTTLSLDYETLRHENDLLREMVMDGYRFHSAEQEELLKQAAEKARLREEEFRRLMYGPRRDAQTQIACSVCAIREFNNGQSHRANCIAAPVSEGVEEQHTVPEVHDTLTTAVGLGTKFDETRNEQAYYAILTAKPRHLTREVVSDKPQRQRNTVETMATMTPVILQNRPFSASNNKRSPPRSRPTSPLQSIPINHHDSAQKNSPLLFTEQVMQIINRPPSPKLSDATGIKPNANSSNNNIHVGHTVLNKRRPLSATAAMIPSSSDLLSGVQQHDTYRQIEPGGSYGAKHVLDYAMSLLHDSRPRPQPQPQQANHSSRPLSGSKFRKIKQMPRSVSASTLQKPTVSSGVAMIANDESAFQMPQEGVRALVHSAALIQQNKQLERSSLQSDGNSSNRRWLPVDLTGSSGVMAFNDEEMDLHSSPRGEN